MGGGGGLKGSKGKREEGWQIKVLGLGRLARAVDWSIDRLHGHDRRQLKRVELKKVRPESRQKDQCPQILFDDHPVGKLCVRWLKKGGAGMWVD